MTPTATKPKPRTKSPAPAGSARKLAKRLALPDSGLVCPDHWSGPDWVLTDGPAVAELNAAIGFEPDPQQELGLDLIFAVGENGLPAAFAFCAVCCRQNLKTGLFKQAATGWLFVTDERTVVWSAHEMSTTLAAQADLADLWQDAPATSKRMLGQKNRGVYTDNNATRIELAGGQQIKFKARTQGGGRGLTGDKVILDEAFALRAAHVGSLIPTMAARPNGQVLYGSSAGMSDSLVLYDVRERGRAGSSPRLAYLEWGTERVPCAVADCQHPKAGVEGCALDDEQLWRRANPTITTGRISIQTIADLRQELPPEEFARECLGWWDEPDATSGKIFGLGRWEACARELDADETPEEPIAIGVAVSVDRTWASIAAATPVEIVEDPEDPEAEPVTRVYVAAVERREYPGLLVKVEGIDDPVTWVVAEAKRIQDEHPDCFVLIDEKGPTKTLIDDFIDADVAVETLTLDDYAEACAMFFDKVRQTNVVHPSSAELDAAIGGAEWRPVGDRRVWGRKQSSTDVSMLEAATLAVYGAEKFGAVIY